MPRLPKPGYDAYVWGDILNNFLSVEHLADGTLKRADVIDAKLDKTGGTMTGDITLDGSTSARTLRLSSSAAGGLNSSDSTSRLRLESYQKAQLNNNDGTNTGQAHYGEVLRIDIKHKQAKGAIAFREDYLGSPQGPRTVAWLVAHGEANDSTPQNQVWHNHFSIELPDENGALQTTLEFPFGTYNTPNAFGVPLSQMYNRSTTKLIAASMGLHVENSAGVSKNIYFSSGSRGLDANRRWSLQADATPEGGSNSGTNYRINRHADDGSFVDSPFFVRRSDGQVGIMTTNPSAALDVVGTTELNGSVSVPNSTVAIGNTIAQGAAKLYVETAISQVGLLFRNSNAGGNTAANIVSQAQTATSRVLQAGLQSDSINRFSVEASGRIEWGAGGNGSRDTTLYRSGTGSLKTDGSFEVGSTLFHNGGTLGFFGTAAVAKPTVSGSTGGNVALGSLLSQLAALGLITNATT